MFYKTTEYPETYKNDYQTYRFGRALLEKSRSDCTKNQKYKQTLSSILTCVTTIYPNPEDRPNQPLTQKHQEKIKEDIRLMRAINAIEAIHQKTFLFCCVTEEAMLEEMQTNCIYLSRIENDLYYSLIAENGKIVTQEKCLISPVNFNMSTVLEHANSILKDAQVKTYISQHYNRVSGDNISVNTLANVPRNSCGTQVSSSGIDFHNSNNTSKLSKVRLFENGDRIRSQDQLTQLETCIQTLQATHDCLNYEYMSYAYFLTYGLMIISATASFMVMTMGIIGMILGIAIFPWAPLISLAFLPPLICCAYLAFKSLDHAINIQLYDAPLKTNLRYYIEDNKKLLQEYQEAETTPSYGNQQDAF